MMQIARFLGQHPTLRICRSFEQVLHRSIYTAEQLSVDKYLHDRALMQMSQQPGSCELKKFNLKKRLLSKNLSPASIMNDFTQFMYTIDDTSEDFALLQMALDKFKGTYIDSLRRISIGSTLMRMLHHFRKDELVLKFYCDSDLRRNYLNGKHCLLLFFDLLFKQKRYTELLRHFQELREQLDSKQLTVTRSIFILVFATCYSQNTEQSFNYAKQLNNQYKDLHITQDHLVFLSALAINQNAPHIADELLLTLWPTAHEAIPTLRLLALIRMQKFTNAIQLLRALMIVYDENRIKKTEIVSYEAITETENSFNQFCDDERLRNDFKQLNDNLKRHGYITDKNVTKMVFEPFRSDNMTKTQRNKMFIHAEFNQNNNYNR